MKNFWLSASGTPVPTGAVIDYSAIQPHVLPHRRFNDYFYAQDEWNFARDWTLTTGVRHDGYSDFGGTTNPRLALVWDATLDVTAKLLYSQAFRAPAFNEQYGVNPTGSGNPNLKPESIRTLEAAFSWQARNNILLNLSIFRYDMKDVITIVANSPPIPGAIYQNTGKWHGSGMELEAVWDAGRALRFTGNYSYQQSIDEATATDAGYAPHRHIYLRGDWRFADRWFSSIQIDRIADRRRPAGDFRPRVPDYTTMDMTVRADKGPWSYAASVRNLFNATVLEPSLAPGTTIPNDLPMAPRSLWLQVTYNI